MISIPVVGYVIVREKVVLRKGILAFGVVAAGIALDAYVMAPSVIGKPYFVLQTFIPFLVIALIGSASIAFLSIFRTFGRAQLGEPIVLLPAAMLVAESMSSGGHSLGQYAPIGLFIALSPILYPAAFERKWVRASATGGCAALAVAGMVSKIERPMEWEYYRSRPMFSGRAWMIHPVYGLSYVDKKDNQFFQNVCRTLGGYGTKVTFLSLPYSYANYYCDVPPWHDYVQTWFDTSSQSEINSLVRQMENKPPEWILYERQLKYLRFHEIFYFHGNKIAHRALDDLIMNNIRGGQWKVAIVDVPRPGDVWMLIHTTARTSTAP
jgi:hypothetical protein